MSGTRKIILSALAILSLMSGMNTAFADQDKHKPFHESDNSYVKKSYNQGPDHHGNNNPANTMRIHDNDRAVLRRYAEDHYKKYCAPSLIKKYGECLQYGQPQKRYVVGYSLPTNILYYPVPRDTVSRLRPIPSGYKYVRVDNDVVLMEISTQKIIDAVVLSASVNR